MENNTISKEEIDEFIEGKNPMTGIVSIECGYGDELVNIIYRDEKGNKNLQRDEFRPFVYAKNDVCIRMFEGDRSKISHYLKEFGIGVKKLKTSVESEESDQYRLNEGFKYLFYAKRKMSYTKFMMFFQMAGTPIYPKEKTADKEASIDSSGKDFYAVSPIEQYMIYSGKRMFKGMDNYDDLKRMLFDLETQGLDPSKDAIDQIGIRTNKGFEKIISISGDGRERLKNEYLGICEFFEIIAREQPDVIAGHNSENFDWNFIIKRLEIMGTSIEDLSKEYFKHSIYKKKRDSALKLGGETEYYRPTIIWGCNVVDSLHAVRRAQATDSNMKSANLKYVTKYLSLNKRNRVYVNGGEIGKIWLETEPVYAFNDEDGTYYKIDENNPIKNGYSEKSGKYIVERYLLDDIWETDQVELKLNECNFLIDKIIPTTFQKACTMGTAGLWKLLMTAWYYEHGLAIPNFSQNRKFVGGLSRLLKTGYIDNIIKLDYNSLYPSIMITWNVRTDLDIQNVMLSLLEYVLTQREKFKKLKKDAGKRADKIENEIRDKEKNNYFVGDKKGELIAMKEEYQRWKGESKANDKKQLPFKIFGNSFFGAYGSPGLYPWGDLKCAEKTTCIGRQCLRLMISWFKNRGYEPIVGDSFTPDTPVYVRMKNSGLIDIRPISDLINPSKLETDYLGREYDYSKKPYEVLCRSGWKDVEYIYRHKSNKNIYSVSDEENGMHIDITEDHSLYDSSKTKLCPNDINENTSFEFYSKEIEHSKIPCIIGFTKEKAKKYAMMVSNGLTNRVPIEILNGCQDVIEEFLENIKLTKKEQYSKTIIASVNFLKNKRSV